MSLLTEVLEGRSHSHRWDVGTLDWIPWDGAVTGGSGGGGDASAAKQDIGNASLASIDGKHPALVSGRVPVDGSGVTQPVSGTFFQATQPVSLASAPTTPVTGAFFQATQPVSGTFFQATQPVSAASLPLPTGAATESTLSTLNGKVTAVNTGAVVVSSSALPSGAATAALQAQPGVDIGDVTINNASGGAAVNVQDGGNSLTVDGTFFQATQPVSLATAPTTPVTGTFFQATQPVSAASLPLPTGAATSARQDTSFGKTLTYVAVAQGAAGTTQLAGASGGNKHKILGAMLTLSATGTLKFLDGVGDLTGAMDFSATGGLVMPTSLIPYQQGGTNSALSITTTGGAAKGVVVLLTEA